MRMHNDPVALAVLEFGYELEFVDKSLTLKIMLYFFQKISIISVASNREYSMIPFALVSID